jgi:hypothetical protein
MRGKLAALADFPFRLKGLAFFRWVWPVVAALPSSIPLCRFCQPVVDDEVADCYVRSGPVLASFKRCIDGEPSAGNAACPESDLSIQTTT